MKVIGSTGYKRIRRSGRRLKSRRAGFLGFLGGSSRVAEGSLRPRSEYERPPRMLGIEQNARSGKLTSCYRPKPRNASLNSSQMSRAVVFAIVAALFAVSHIYLRFSIGDLKLERLELQQTRRELSREFSRIERDVVALADFRRLQDKAEHELGMLRPDTDQVAMGVIPDSMYERYLGNSEEFGRTYASGSLRNENQDSGPLDGIVRLLLDGSFAFAGQK